jgi:hypothetical protein
MIEDLTTFMLTSIAKEKRQSGSDSGTITERTKCLPNTTGIEPLCGELSEILSRSFVINFDLANQASDCFLGSEVIPAIQQNRDLIISAIMKRTSHVLAMIRDGAQKQVMRLLHRTMPAHGKRRCNDYMSLMVLTMLAGSEEHEVITGLEDLSPLFIERYQVRFENENTMEPVSAGRLDAKVADQSSRFGFELLIDEIIYEFSFAVTRKAILEEKLAAITSTSEKVLYHRRDGKPNFDDSLAKDPFLQFAFKGTRDNQLFLVPFRLLWVNGKEPFFRMGSQATPMAVFGLRTNPNPYYPAIT